MKPSGRGTRAAFFLFAILVTVFSLACGGLSPSRPPNPTPLPLTDLRVVELGTDVRISGFRNGEAVGIGEEGEVYLVTVATGENRQLTNDGHSKWGAVIAADHVAWLDQRRKLALPGSTSKTPRYATDIFLLDRRTGEVRRITDEPAERYGLQISNSRLVWQDDRNERKDGFWEFDIYAFDIESGREIPVAIAPGAQQGPAIYGDTVVWADNRNSPPKGTGKSHCSNCAGNPFDIYAYDFTSGKESLLFSSGRNNGSPSVYGRYIVWQEFDEDDGSRIRLLDGGTGQQRTLAEAGRNEAMPVVSDDYVVWTVRQACDVVGPDTGRVRTGVFAYNLKTAEIRQLSNYIEPQAWLSKADDSNNVGNKDGNVSDNVVLIQEGCHVISRTYAVYLE